MIEGNFGETGNGFAAHIVEEKAVRPVEDVKVFSVLFHRSLVKIRVKEIDPSSFYVDIVYEFDGAGIIEPVNQSLYTKMIVLDTSEFTHDDVEDHYKREIDRGVFDKVLQSHVDALIRAPLKPRRTSRKKVNRGKNKGTVT